MVFFLRRADSEVDMTVCYRHLAQFYKRAPAARRRAHRRHQSVQHVELGVGE